MTEHQYSMANYNSAEEPFFMQAPVIKSTIENNNDSLLPDGLNGDKIMNEKEILTKEEINQLTEDCIFPDALKNFFVGRPHNCEIYINNWTIMSLKNMMERHKIVSKDCIVALDIGFRYMGMGHIKMVFYDPINKCYFFRHEGGSNGYDREYNYNKLKNYKYDGDKSYGFTFVELLKQMEGTLDNKDYIF